MNKINFAQHYKVSLNNVLILQESGNYSKALKLCKTLVKNNSKDCNLLNIMGTLYGQIGDLNNCIKVLNKSINLNKKQEHAFHNLALAYEKNDEFEHAIRHYNSALVLNPKSTIIHNNLGDLFKKIGNFKDALNHLNQSLLGQPDFESALTNKASLLTMMGNHEEADKIYQKLVMLYPLNALVLNNYSAFLQLTEHFDKAERYIRKALDIVPQYPKALNNLGNILIKREKYTEAKSVLLQTIALDPFQVEAYINLGFLSHNTADYAVALEYYNKAIQLDPKNGNARWYRTFTLLLIAKFEVAWDDYEYRFSTDDHVNDQFDLPLCNPESIPQSSLLITAEQGVGDQIMFASCLPDLLKQTSSIVLECEKRLLPVLQRSFPNIRMFYHNELSNDAFKRQFPDINTKISIGSLPRLYRRSTSSFSESKTYLLTDNDKYTRWKKRYVQIGRKLKVGISWKGGTIVDAKNRSMSLDSWKSILKCDCLFISLQYGDHRDEISNFEKDHGIQIYQWEDSDSLKDLDDFSAQVSALDLIISVGNTNVHLAGALGVPTWCVLPKVPSWRWLYSGEKCLWYPSVRIYRQQNLFEWEPVLKNIVQDLTILTSKTSS